jgi:hypothetical protein
MSNAVSKIQADEKPRWLSVERLDELRQRGAHVLVPNQYQSQVSPIWQGVYEIVFLSPNTADKDCWPLPGGGGKVGLSKTGLWKLGRAAGIEPFDSKVDAERDGYIRMTARVRQRDASGAWVYAHGTKNFDRKEIWEETYQTTLSKNKGNEALAKAKADEDTRRFWKFSLERCETGAYLRAIRTLMAIRGDFSPAELKAPFVVRAVHFAPDQSVPELREATINAAKLTAVQLWGNRPEDRQELELETGRTIAELSAQREQIQQLKNGPSENGPPEDDGYDAFEAAVRGATPADAPFLADEEEV